MKHSYILLGCLLNLSAYGSGAPAVKVPDPLTAAARIAKAEYCFAEPHNLRVERNPPPPLVLKLHLDVAYHNTAARPVILPWQFDRSLYTALTPGVMKATHENPGLFTPSVVMMMHLPANVSPGNPVDPPNDEFRVIPPGGHITLPLVDLVTVPIHSDSRPKVDLRGKTFYLRMKFSHRELSPALEAELSDRWTRYGVPWTGDILTNTMVVNVPTSPDAAECVDRREPTEGKDIDRSLKLQR